MTSDKKNIDEMPERRSDRSIPLNVETVLVAGARNPKKVNPDDENEKLKDDGSDLETIRGDIENEDTTVRKPKSNNSSR